VVLDNLWLGLKTVADGLWLHLWKLGYACEKFDASLLLWSHGAHCTSVFFLSFSAIL